MEQKILHLTLKKKWFDLIKSGEKKVEYREIKPYWFKRLFEKSGEFKQFDYIIFTNGYRKDSPKMKVEIKNIFFPIEFEEKQCYAIKLGKVVKG